MRHYAMAAALLSGCAPQTRTSPGYPSCAVLEEVLSADASPFGEPPADTFQREGTFAATISWADPTNPVPTSWVHAPEGSASLHAARGPEGCDVATVRLSGEGWLDAGDGPLPSRFSSSWSTPDAPPSRFAGVELGLDVASGPLFDWVTDVLAELGEPLPPPYGVALALRDDDGVGRADLAIVSTAEPLSDTVEAAPRLTGTVEITLR